MKKDEARLALGRECGRVGPTGYPSLASRCTMHSTRVLWPCGPMPAHQDDARRFTRVQLVIPGYCRIHLPLFLFLFLFLTRSFFTAEKKNRY
jgi:hypothetical protein